MHYRSTLVVCETHGRSLHFALDLVTERWLLYYRSHTIGWGQLAPAPAHMLLWLGRDVDVALIVIGQYAFEFVDMDTAVHTVLWYMPHARSHRNMLTYPGASTLYPATRTRTHTTNLLC